MRQQLKQMKNYHMSQSKLQILRTIVEGLQDKTSEVVVSDFRDLGEENLKFDPDRAPLGIVLFLRSKQEGNELLRDVKGKLFTLVVAVKKSTAISDYRTDMIVCQLSKPKPEHFVFEFEPDVSKLRVFKVYFIRGSVEFDWIEKLLIDRTVADKFEIYPKG